MNTSSENLNLIIKCSKCKNEITAQDLRNKMYVCPYCGFMYPISAFQRLSLLYDNGEYTEMDRDFEPRNPLSFPGYDEKLEGAQKKTGLKEAVVSAFGRIGGKATVTAVMDYRFLMGSMSSVVGEKLTRTIEFATSYHLPLVIFSASGGARVQEGIYSLAQMVKTSSAIQAFSDAGGLFISYFTNPTAGGVTASFASLGDIFLAEPDSFIGFAGPRVIEQTIKKKLPKDFQKGETLEKRGFVDKIVRREDMRDTLIRLLDLHNY